MVRHRALDTWLLPGGHLDDQDEHLIDAALRELEEETGVRRDEVTPLSTGHPLDIDVHRIPANPAKREARHWHADFRYLFRADRPAVTPQLDEVTRCTWLAPALPHTGRLAEKVASLTRPT